MDPTLSNMITFIATSYKETYDAYMFISSLKLQTNNNWRCIIFNDGPNEFIKKVVDEFNDDRITYYESDVPMGSWGHYSRQTALNYVDTEFLIQTSIQDYYIPTTVEDILNVSISNDLILFNCLHNHFNYGILNSLPKINRVDWGCHAIRTSVAKNVGIQQPESSVCDGIFVENCLKYPGLRYHKIEKILTTHN